MKNDLERPHIPVYTLFLLPRFCFQAERESKISSTDPDVECSLIQIVCVRNLGVH